MRNETPEDGWTRVAFGEVVELSRERSSNPERDGFRRYVGLEHIEPGDLKIRRWGLIADGTTFTNIFRAGQVLFGKRRAYQRKVAVPDFDGVCSGDIYVLKARTSHLLPGLLPFICQTDGFFEHAVETSAGSLSPRTNWESLSSYGFTLPPLEEQLRIVGVLREAAATYSALTVATDCCREVYRAASGTLFGGILWSADSTGQPLGEHLEEITDKGHAGLPILSVTIDGRVVRREVLGRHVSDETGEAKYTRAQVGDIAYNTMRLWQGAVGIVQEEGLISPAYTVMRGRRGNLPPEYIWEMLRSAAFRREYRRLVRGVASDRWRVYYKDLASLLVRIPTDEVIHKSVCDLTEIRETIGRLTSRADVSASILAALRRRILDS